MSVETHPHDQMMGKCTIPFKTLVEERKPRRVTFASWNLRMVLSAMEGGEASLLVAWVRSKQGSTLHR